METMQISITTGLKDYLQSQAAKRGLSSPHEYLQTLLAELEHHVKMKREFETSLLEAVRSPEVTADAEFWAERRRKVLDKHPELQ